MAIGAILTKNSITVNFSSGPKTIDNTHPNWERVRESLKTKNKTAKHWGRISELMDLPKAIANWSKGKTQVSGGTILYAGKEVHNVLADRILDLMKEGYEVDPLLKFLDNLMDNPSNQSVNELYLFLEANKLPITEDGHFLAYKKVTYDYKDCHTRTYDNSIGANPKMERNAVDDRRDVVCSHGFHVAAFTYAKNFQNGRMMVVKINPKDVVSVPNDYNNQKMRVSEYRVVGELKDHSDILTGKSYAANSFYNVDLDDEEEGED